MQDLITLLAVAIGAVVAVIPYLTKWLCAKFSKNTSKEKLEELELQQKVELLSRQQEKNHDETQKTLNNINLTLDKVSNVHGLNPDDIICKQDINEELERFRTLSEADRVTVWSFHNGNYFSTGVPQRKLTTVFEATPPDKDIGSEYDLIQGELLNGFALVLKRLSLGAVQNKGGTSIEPGMTVYSSCERCPLFKQCGVLPSQRPYNCILRCDIDDMPMSSKFYRVMKKLGTKIWYGRTICNEMGLPVGVVTVQYNLCGQAANQFLDKHSQEWCDTCTRIISSIAYMFDIR